MAQHTPDKQIEQLTNEIQQLKSKIHSEMLKAGSAVHDTAVVTLDASGCIKKLNACGAQVLHSSEEEALGRLFTQFLATPTSKSLFKAVFEEALSGSSPETASLLALGLGGKEEEHTLIVNAFAERDRSGEISGVICVGQIVEGTSFAGTSSSSSSPLIGNSLSRSFAGSSSSLLVGTSEAADDVLAFVGNGVQSALAFVESGVQSAKSGSITTLAFVGSGVHSAKCGSITIWNESSDKAKELAGFPEKTRVAQELQNIIDTANAPIFGIDVNGLVNEWNTKAAEITGFEKSEVLGQNLVQVFTTEEYRVSVKEVLDLALNGQDTANFEFPLYTKDQTRVEVLLNATARRNVSGKVVGMIGVGQHIIERKQVEVQMTRVAQELQTFIDTANAPIFGIDANGLVNEWNNMAAEITHFSRREVLGQDLVQVYISEEFRSSVRTVLDNALNGLGTANYEFPLYTKDKRRVDVLLNATPRRDATGTVVGVIGVGQDITERKEIEEEKTRVAQELQNLIDTANAPIFGIDDKGLVNEWNNMAAEITPAGFPKQEVLGRNLVEDFITEEFRASVKEVLDNALQGREKSNFEFPLFTKDQRRVEVLLNATTRRDVTGAIVGMIGVGQDITEMRRLMEQEALLFQAQAANDAKSQFLATMSHEMRTPLNVIMGMNALVLDTLLTAEQRKFGDQIKSSSESLLVLINDILDLTKIEAGKLELVPVIFDLRTLMEETVDSVASKAMSKGLEICSYVSPQMQTIVNSDPDRLRQIFLNLLSNGIKFTDKGQVYFVVEEDEQTATHQTFRFKVYDSGIGISEQGQKKLFSRFSQVDSSTTRTYGGTGLGLAISKQFSELMDGSMGVRSEQGKGSLFWFTAVFRRAPESDQVRFPILKDFLLPPRGVLIVSGNATIRNSLQRYMESFELFAQTIESVAQIETTFAQRDFEHIIICPAVGMAQIDREDSAASGPPQCSGRTLSGSSLQESPNAWNDLDVCNGRTLSGSGFQESPSAWNDLEVCHGPEGVISVLQFLEKFEQTRPHVQCVVLCPITHLNVAARIPRSPNHHILSRPFRLTALYEVLFPAAQTSFAGMDNTLAYASAAFMPPALLDPGYPEPVQEHDRLSVLVASKDTAHSMALRSMLTNQSHTCHLFDNLHDVNAALAAPGETTCEHDIVVLEFGANDSDKQVLEVIARANQLNVTAIALVPQLGGSEAAAASAAGVSAVLSKPLTLSAFQRCLANLPTSRKGGKKGPEGREYATANGGVAASGANLCRVLVVDDDSGQRMMLRVMLEKSGFDVDTAEDGAQAVRAVKRVGYDVVLMDGFMPKMTGWEACEAIRLEEKTRGAKNGLIIIGVTGATSKEDKDKCLSCGMTDVVTKPVSKDKLILKMEHWIGQQFKLSDDMRVMSGSNSPVASPRKVLRALVADADAGQRLMCKSLLKKIGLQCDAVGSGADVLDKVKAEAYDVVLLAQNLRGELTSVVTAQHIRARDKEEGGEGGGGTPGVCVIIELEAKLAKPSSLDHSRSDHFTDTLVKPLNVQTVKECISKHLAINGWREAKLRKTPIGVGAAFLRTPRILIVEDHWANRKLLEAMLKKDHELECVENGLQAVKITEMMEFDLVLMDCNMPVMDGWQATEKIRQRGTMNHKTPIVAVTANAMKGDREKCFEWGMDDYISKPINKKTLYELIQKWTQATGPPVAKATARGFAAPLFNQPTSDLSHSSLLEVDLQYLQN